MTSLLLDWVAYPLLLAVLSLGSGLLLDRCCEARLPGILLLPGGFALMIVASTLTTMSPSSAPSGAPMVVGLALLGFALSLRRRFRIDGLALAAGLGVFAVYAAPIVLSGSATFAGYISLDDTATWLALADNAVVHGRDMAMLAPSTYSTVLNDYLATGYPLGAFVTLGIGHELSAQDSAWLFQPQIAFLAAMLGLALYALCASLVDSRALRFLAAFLGAQAALLYGYAFWSGIKELTAALLVALLAALLAALPGARTALRDVLPIAVAVAALLDVLAIVGLVWLGALAPLALAALLSRHRRRVCVLAAGALAASAALAIPALATAGAFLRGSGGITTGGVAGLANLFQPLSSLQIFGIWPAGDFRLRPQSMTSAQLLIALAALCAALGLLVAVRRRAWGVPLYLGFAAAGAFAVVELADLGHGSSWLDGKALAIASPAFVASAAAGASTLARGRSRVLGLLLIAVLGAGVLWSNALAYSNVWLAPRAQLGELETIGQRFAGDGPTLMTEYEPYGVRHFLRELDPEGASERRARPIALRAGGVLAKQQYADIDAFDLAAILVYRTLVLRTSPVASRPPSDYRLVWSGRYYEVWQRPVHPAPILEHLSLGTLVEPDSEPSCAQVRRLAALALRHGGTLLASERPTAIVAALGDSPAPPSWQVQPDGTIHPVGAGSEVVEVVVSSAGEYGFWLGGSFRDTMRVSVDGSPVGVQTDQLSETDQLVPFGTVFLSAGNHRVTLSYSRSELQPGSGGYSPFSFGPLEIGQPAASARLVEVLPSSASSLCGKSLDWIEAVA